MNTNVQKTIVVILVLVALGLGGLIYYKQQQKTKAPETATNNPSPTPTPTPTPPVSTAGLTADEKVLFSPLPDKPTQAMLDEKSAVANRVAKAGTKITIKDCTADPIVLLVKHGTTISIANTGKSDIHFGFNTDRTLIKAGATASIKTDFDKGPGLYGYGCDDTTLNRAIGMILTTP